MNTEILTRSGIDYDKGVKRFLGRAHLFEKTLSKFLKDDTFSRIRLAYAQGDMEKLFAGVHEFKGMCGNIALTSLYNKADAIVCLLRTGGYSPVDLQDAYKSLDAEYNAVYAAVSAAMEGSA